ncbi:MAG: hypothetical protein M1825_001969 [Sarcosagium campestre]|nr:MAG: hypothetical protein M1825_001969 [Sarcosagium campestre]
MSSPMPVPGTRPGTPHVPGPGSQDSGAADANGVSVRPMRLKVLYTFDDDNKTNCLARWPHVLNVQSVSLDETTLIGVIELKTCIQAIVSASPELVAKLGHDYTVYAYDYSEYETPLVGQGLLSWALASASPTPGAPAHQSRTVITGRVCKNILGVFSNGVKETLEVKLRLVPVPTCLQSEYISSMEKYRSLSKVIPVGFDVSAWNAYLEANPHLLDLASNVTDRPPNEETKNPAGMELLAHLLNQGVSAENVIQTLSSSFSQMQQPATRMPASQENQDTTPYHDHQDQNSHWSPSMTPEQSEQVQHTVQMSVEPPALQPAQAVLPHTTAHSTPLNPASQPASRPPSRPPLRAIPLAAKRPMPMNTTGPSVVADPADGPGSNGVQDDGPSKKRARVTKADWSGKSTLGEGADSLRVAASNAASMRLFRPIAINPASVQAAALEPPRVPTPPPNPNKQSRTQTRRKPQSGLRHDSLDARAGSGHAHTHPSTDRCPSAERAITSPEEFRSYSNTPYNIPSSPPVMSEVSPTPSSPTLPALPRQIDSGFMSGNMDELFEDRAAVAPSSKPSASAAKAGPRVGARKKKPAPVAQVKEFTIEEVNPGPKSLLPTKILPRPTHGKRPLIASAASSPPPPASRSLTAPQATIAPLKPDAVSNQQMNAAPRAQPLHLPNAPAPPPASRAGTRTPSMGGLLLPQQVASDPVTAPAPLQRSQTWSGNGHANSDAPVPLAARNDSVSRAEADPPKQRTGSGTKRHRAIQRRLEMAIASGQMPPFCENCGSIDTPTWRKAWIKVITGSSKDVRVSDEEHGIVGIVELGKDDQGNVTSYSILKKTCADSDEGFREIQLCNPCGLWLFKTKCMRPREMWDKEARDPNEKKRPRTKRKQSVSEGEAAAADVSKAEGSNMERTYSSEAVDDTQPADDQNHARKRPRAASDQPESHPFAAPSLEGTAAAKALQRAIQSSPARHLGTKASPIDLEDFGTTRRLLFPSPNNKQQQQQGHGQAGNALTEERARASVQSSRSPSAEQADKENCPPEDVSEADLALLFEGEDGHPTTPTRSSTSFHLFKTPGMVTPLKQTADSHSPWENVFSTTGKDALLPPRTPSTRDRSPTSALGSAVKFTPLTAQIREILSAANNTSPSRPSFDCEGLQEFGDALGAHGGSDLPDAHNTSQFALPNIPRDARDFFSTDMAMPSSPPRNFFSLYEDPPQHQGSTLWSDYAFDDYTAGGDSNNAEYHPKAPSDGTGLVVDESGRASIALEFGKATNDSLNGNDA